MFQSIQNNDLVKGILIGAGVSIVAFCAYKSNPAFREHWVLIHHIIVLWMTCFALAPSTFSLCETPGLTLLQQR